MKVLIVDDEPRVLQALNRVLRHAVPRDWVVSTASSGFEALEHLGGNGGVDVVVSDMRMPEMDGTALLGHVRTRWPDTVRVVLSGHSDPDASIRVASIAHQFYEKPLPIKDFVAALHHIEEVRRGITAGPPRDALGAVGDLPAAPAVYTELTAAIADPRVHADDLAGIVRRDPALVAKVLQLAGSAFFNRGGRSDDLRSAIGRLGVRTIAALALSASAFRVDPSSGLSQDRLSTHALTAATAAQTAVGDPALAEDAFIAALLADVGLSALACWLPDHVREARAHALGHACSLAAAERELFGVTHAELGAYVLGLWRLPSVIVDAVASHHVEDATQLAGRPVAQVTHAVHSAAAAGAVD